MFVKKESAAPVGANPFVCSNAPLEPLYMTTGGCPPITCRENASRIVYRALPLPILVEHVSDVALPAQPFPLQSHSSTKATCHG